MMTRAIVLVLVLPCALKAEFAIRDGDTVVFLGDSITAARGYGKVVENYTLLRYPDRKVRFINAGWGGDTAAGGAARLERDVLSRGATLVTVAYGINDIGWGSKADDEHKQKYLDGVRDIVNECTKRGVRVFICSAAITGADPEKSENDYLQRMCDEGMALSRSLGGGAIDLQRSMREIQKRVWAANITEKKEGKDKHTLHAADGIHLNDLGQLAMGFAMLKGLGAPAEVSSVKIDISGKRPAQTSGCKVSGIEVTPDGLEFERLDEGLPLNFGPLGALRFRFIPIPDQLNRYMLAVKGLSPGRYELTVSGRAVGTWTAEQLAGDINISSATPDGWVPGGPWDAQAATLIMLTDSRNELVQAEKLSGMYLGGNPNLDASLRQVTDVNQRMESLQRTVARPTPYRFVLKRRPPASQP